MYNTGYVQGGQRGFPSITGVLGDDWDAWVNDTNCFCLAHEHIRTHTGLQFFFVCPAYGIGDLRWRVESDKTRDVNLRAGERNGRVARDFSRRLACHLIG